MTKYLVHFVIKSGDECIFNTMFDPYFTDDSEPVSSLIDKIVSDQERLYAAQHFMDVLRNGCCVKADSSHITDLYISPYHEWACNTSKGIRYSAELEAFSFGSEDHI